MSGSIKKIFKIILYFFLRDKMFVLVHRFKYYEKRKKIIKKAREYNKIKEALLKKKSTKQKIRILFFVYDLNMWKYEGLMRILLNQPKFDPIIIPFIMPEKSDEINKKNRDEIVEYCHDNSFPIKDGFDFQRREYQDLTDMDPDIVIYAQPYDTGYKNWCIDNFAGNSLFVYTPYGISTSENRALRDTYLMNISWKIFVSCQLEKNVYRKDVSCTESDIVITGADIFDQLKKADPEKTPWRKNGKKKIIWAPHHSIDSKRGFSNSNFERICFDMLELAKKYEETVEIAFKPHPVLYERLIEKWGKEKTDAYYATWTQFPNTILCLGRYRELFAFSDAMIHDCASFSYEYLCVNKPVMFVSRNHKPPTGVGNELGKACFERHYQGYSIQEIEAFIKTVVIEGQDPMKSQRESFIREQLLQPNDESVGANMFREINQIFSRSA